MIFAWFNPSKFILKERNDSNKRKNFVNVLYGFIVSLSKHPISKEQRDSLTNYLISEIIIRSDGYLILNDLSSKLFLSILNKYPP